MGTIKSFQVDHEKLEPGIYISRNDVFGRGLFTGEVITIDLRFTRPNREPPMDPAAIHTIEHLGAVYLRNYSGCEDEIVYFGPMGCRTGFYLIIWGDRLVRGPGIVNLMKNMCEYILDFEGEIPGAKPAECGNYLEHDLGAAKSYAKKFLEDITARYYRRGGYIY